MQVRGCSLIFFSLDLQGVSELEVSISDARVERERLAVGAFGLEEISRLL